MLEQQVPDNVISIGGKFVPPPNEVGEHFPIYERIMAAAQKIEAKSSYKSDFDYTAYRALEKRFSKKPIRGGITFRSPFRLVNSHATCQQCLYAFEIDTYGRGCVHNCVYCYAKAELTVHGYWNNPVPVPVDVNEIRKVFHTVFETTRESKYRPLMERRIPLRIGSMSDSFMWLDAKYGVTKELIKILNHYRYPYLIFTRSDLIARDDYLSLLDKKLCAVQFSMSSLNEDLTRKIEPGAPPVRNRLAALEKISKAGFWTTVRINPIFPIHPDGYFSDPDFKWPTATVPKFDFTSFDMVDAIAARGVPAILAGFGRFSSFSMNQLHTATGIDLKPFFRKDLIYKSKRDYHFTDREVRYYYAEFKRRCDAAGVQFTTCYIGNGNTHFWGDQDLWSNKADCCNVRSRVDAFKTDSREIPFQTRLGFTNHQPAPSDDLHKPLGTNPIGAQKKPTLSSDRPTPNELS